MAARPPDSLAPLHSSGCCFSVLVYHIRIAFINNSVKFREFPPTLPRCSFGVVLWEIATVQTPIRGQLRDVKWAPPAMRGCLLEPACCCCCGRLWCQARSSRPELLSPRFFLQIPPSTPLSHLQKHSLCLVLLQHFCPHRLLQPTRVYHTETLPKTVFPPKRARRVPEECPAVARELILDCLATNPRKRPTAVEIAARLAAMPDLRPPPGAPTRQPSRRLFRPTAPAPAGPAESTAAAGLASRGEMALVPGDFAAAAAAVQLRAEERQARHGLPCSQRSSEESNMSMILPEESTLAAAYASPVPGTAAALPLPAATHGGSAGLPAGALDAAAAPLLQQPLETGAPLAPGRLYRASSSTPRAGLGAEPQGSPPSGGTDSGGGEGHLPSPAHTDQPAPHAAPAGAVHPESSGDEPSPFASPAAQRQLGPRPPRPAFNRAASLDDPGRQLAGALAALPPSVRCRCSGCLESRPFRVLAAPNPTNHTRTQLHTHAWGGPQATHHLPRVSHTITP
jgi:hypothetical protein